MESFERYHQRRQLQNRLAQRRFRRAFIFVPTNSKVRLDLTQSSLGERERFRKSLQGENKAHQHTLQSTHHASRVSDTVPGNGQRPHQLVHNADGRHSLWNSPQPATPEIECSSNEEMPWIHNTSLTGPSFTVGPPFMALVISIH